MAVVNDVVTDQRVQRVCSTLFNNGFEVTVIGRRFSNSLDIENKPYKIIRMKMLINKGPFFYFFFNLRLFFLLLFKPFDIAHANDLDTLSSMFLAAKIKNKPIVYDSHELFTEVPELINRPFVRKIWLYTEKMIVPKLRVMFTVNDSIAKIYSEKYNVSTITLRNFPVKIKSEIQVDKSYFKLPENKKLIILQGAGINIDRGAEEAVEAMKYLNNCILIIAGSGDVISFLKRYVEENNLKEKVIFYNKMPSNELHKLTMLCDCGLTLDKNTNLNYYYSLPNKLFDYIRANIPVISSDLPEVKSVVDGYKIGLVLKNHTVNDLVDTINKILFEIPRSHWIEALKIAADELCWEKEENKLVDYYARFKK